MIKLRAKNDSISKDLEAIGYHPVIAGLMSSRGVSSRKDVELRLSDLEDVSSLRGVHEAAELIKDAIFEQKKIYIIGDYDVDGATSTALLMDFLTQCDAQVDFLIPNRVTEGYGLSPALVERAAAQGAEVLITVDNGISAMAGVLAAKAKGMTIIVTDHHLPGLEIPPADAIVNPNQPDCVFPWKSTCGVGVAFYLSIAVKEALLRCGYLQKDAMDMRQFLDLVALGTVADVVPLERNNRILVRAGLKRMREGDMRPGLMALMRVSGTDFAYTQGEDLGFRLGPRLNAVGRLDDMSVGVRLLLTEDEDEALELANLLNNINVKRRKIEEKMVDEALQQAQALLTQTDLHPLGQTTASCVSDENERRILCLLDENGHEGVVGLVAGKIRENTGLPTLVFAPGENRELLKGSGRSVPDVHIRDFLAQIDALHPGLILGFGGHAMAAGLTIRRADFSLFSEIVQTLGRQFIPKEALGNRIWVDGKIPPDQISMELAESLEALGPYGNGFPQPLFTGTFKVIRAQRIGQDGQTLRMVMRPVGVENGGILAIKFKCGDRSDPIPERLYRVVYTLSVNRFRGDESLQCIVQDIFEAPQ